MTTLIIHPELAIQKKHASELASTYLNITLTPAFDAIPPDLHLLDGTLSSSIGIDDVRNLIKQLQYHPYQSPHQVGLILMANMLTEEAQNSLLKILEEPTPQTRFILTTPHEKFLLPTILSRSQKIFVPESLPPVRISSDETGEQAPDIRSFLSSSVVDRFLHVEELVAADKETRGTIMEFLAELLQFYRVHLLKATRAKQLDRAKARSQDIHTINRAVHFISKNTNKRLTLENLILQLEKSIMLSRQASG